MSKTTVKAARRNAALVALINGASTLGYAFSGGFEAAVASARKLVPSTFLTLSEEQRKTYAPMIRDFGTQFKAGHLLRYLEGRGYEKRLGNMDTAQRIEAMVEIMDKAEPDSDKTNVRTELEHKGVKTAQNAWTRVRDAAGLKPKPVASPNRGASKRRAAGDEKAVPTARVTAPAMHAPVEALAFFQNVSADLLKAVNANARVVPIELKTAVQDFRKAIRDAVAVIKSGKPAPTRRTRKAPVAAVIAASGNGAAKPNGAAAN
jgi:hypothetical protein